MLTPLDQAQVPLDEFRFHQAQLVVPVSMAKIQGQQNPAATADVFTHEFLRFAPHPTVDPYVLLTEGLYANNANLSAFEWRRCLDAGIEFRRKFLKRIHAAAAREVLILPEAYQVHSWDETIYRDVCFAQSRGVLRNAYHDDPDYRAAVNADLASQGRQITPDAVAFLNEEHALAYDLFAGNVDLNRNLSKGDGRRQMMIAYHGGMMRSQILAYRLLRKGKPVPSESWLFADTSQRPMRIYDVGSLVSLACQ